MAGYSKTPLVKKIGIKEGFRIMLINVPSNYFNMLEGLPDQVEQSDYQVDFIHFFTNDAAEVMSSLKKFMSTIVSNGMIWVSWYKKKSGKQKDVDENLIRNVAISLGLVDIKVCAVDNEWSGLKLVIRKENR